MLSMLFWVLALLLWQLSFIWKGRQPQPSAPEKQWHEVGDSFTTLCRENFYLGIFPGQPGLEEHPNYQALARIAQLHFGAGKEWEFSHTMTEGTYGIHLWGAYLILTLYKGPNEKLRRHALEIIRDAANASAEHPEEPFWRAIADWLRRHPELVERQA